MNELNTWVFVTYMLSRIEIVDHSQPWMGKREDALLIFVLYGLPDLAQSSA